MHGTGRVALVTGGGRGIGAAIAARLAAGGVSVAIVDVDGAAAAGIAGRLSAGGTRCLGLAADVTAADQVRKSVDAAERDLGPIDMLINNAGGSSPVPGTGAPETAGPAATAAMDPEYFDYVFRLNVRSAFLCSQAVIPGMVDRRWGRIVSISSSSVFYPFLPAGIAYPSSKAAILGFTRHLAAELAPHGVTCNAVAPGITRSERVERTFLSGGKADEVLATIPAGRPADPAEVAGAVAYLCSDEAAYVTGTTLHVNGGWCMA